MQDIHTFYLLQLETRRRQGVPVQPWRFFERMGKNMIEAGHGFISWFSGYDYHFRDTYPNDLLAWNILEWGSKNGFHSFNFGGGRTA